MNIWLWYFPVFRQHWDNHTVSIAWIEKSVTFDFDCGIFLCQATLGPSNSLHCKTFRSRWQKWRATPTNWWYGRPSSPSHSWMLSARLVSDSSPDLFHLTTDIIVPLGRSLSVQCRFAKWGQNDGCVCMCVSFRFSLLRDRVILIYCFKN